MIKVRADGPYKVTGPVRLTDAEGEPLADARRAAGALPLRALAHQALLRPLASHRCRAAPAPSTPGSRRPRQGEPFLPGPVFAAPYHFSGDGEGRASRYYGRYANPTWERWEAALGELEGGARSRSPPGMAAISAVLLTTLGPGDVLVAPRRRYYTVRTLAREHSSRRRRGPARRRPTTAAVRGALAGATLVWLESPTQPAARRRRRARRSPRLAHEAGALVAVDNTLATPLRQRPLELGADFSVASAAKQLTGHSDLLLGHVAARDAERAARAARVAHDDGRDPGPVRDLARAPLAGDARAARRAPGAQRRPRWRDAARAREDVREVRWPGVGCVVSLRPRATQAGRGASSARAGSSPRRRASAACTRAPSAARAGAATRCRRGSIRLSAASRTPMTCSPTSRAALRARRGARQGHAERGEAVGPAAYGRAGRWPPGNRLRLLRLRPRRRQVARAVPGLRGVEHARRGARARAPGARRGRARARGRGARRGAGARCATCRPSARRACRPASASSTACSAAGSCPARSCCSAARRGSASRR